MKSFAFRRPLALLTVALILAVSPAWAVDATFSGRVFEADGLTPQSGVTVNLIEGEGRTVYSSESTGANGTFVIDGAPVGSYSLLVETPQGAFLSPVPLELHEGANKPLALSLNASNTGLGNEGGIDGWAQWLIIGLLIFGGLYVASSVANGSSSGSFEGGSTPIVIDADDLAQ
jgi:hypothetical protein